MGYGSLVRGGGIMGSFPQNFGDKDYNYGLESGGKRKYE